MSAERGEGSQGTWGGASSEATSGTSPQEGLVSTDCDPEGPAFLKHSWVHGCSQPWIALGCRDLRHEPHGLPSSWALSSASQHVPGTGTLGHCRSPK